MSQRIISVAETCRRTAQSRSGLWRLVKAGRFPTPVSLGTPRRIGYHEAEVEEWIAARPRVEYKAAS